MQLNVKMWVGMRRNEGINCGDVVTSVPTAGIFESMHNLCANLKHILKVRTYTQSLKGCHW
jgi:hypothetical protein